MKRIILAIALTFVAGSAFAQQFLYSAKIVCGRTNNANTLAFNMAPGTYFTTINVHNPSGVNASIRKRFSIGLAGEQVGPLSQFFGMTLPPARTMQIDCRNIWGHLNVANLTFEEGFVEIRSNVELDVVGVYTATPPGGTVMTMFMERVPKRP